MKRILIFVIATIFVVNIKAQILQDVDSLVIKVGVASEIDNWTYFFSTSKECIHVRGADFYPCCYDKRKGVYYMEKITREYVLYDTALINPQSKDIYINEIFQKTENIIGLEKETEEFEDEATYDTVWHFLLYRNGRVVGYYYFDSTAQHTCSSDLADLFLILYQIKRHQCNIYGRDIGLIPVSLKKSSDESNN